MLKLLRPPRLRSLNSLREKHITCTRHIWTSRLCVAHAWTLFCCEIRELGYPPYRRLTPIDMNLPRQRKNLSKFHCAMGFIEEHANKMDGWNSKLTEEDPQLFFTKVEPLLGLSDKTAKGRDRRVGEFHWSPALNFFFVRASVELPRMICELQSEGRWPISSVVFFFFSFFPLILLFYIFLFYYFSNGIHFGTWKTNAEAEKRKMAQDSTSSSLIFLVCYTANEFRNILFSLRFPSYFLHFFTEFVGYPSQHIAFFYDLWPTKYG